MAKTAKLYGVVRDVPGYPFDPCGFASNSIQAAKKELKLENARHPGAYLAEITYTRYAPAKKGR